MLRISKRNRALLGLGLVLAAGSAVFGLWWWDGTGPSSVGTHRTTPRFVVGRGSDTLPSETARDWVSYADQLSVVTVSAEREASRSALAAETGEGYLGRRVVIDVGDPLWRRAGATPLTGRTELLVLGWGLLSSRSILPLSAGKVSLETIAGHPTAFVSRLEGEQPSAVAAILQRTVPDPLAVEAAELPPDERWELVRDGRTG
jgi:hypothetical protein